MAEGRVEILVNGEKRQVDAGTTVLSLLADTVLGEGDRIEIVTFVGGG
jgi:sulfur carrier protein ThiS